MGKSMFIVDSFDWLKIGTPTKCLIVSSNTSSGKVHGEMCEIPQKYEERVTVIEF